MPISFISSIQGLELGLRANSLGRCCEVIHRVRYRIYVLPENEKESVFASYFVGALVEAGAADFEAISFRYNGNCSEAWCHVFGANYFHRRDVFFQRDSLFHRYSAWYEKGGYTPAFSTHPMEGSKRVTVAADKGYDTKEFVREMRGMRVTPHVAQNDQRRGGSAIDGRTTRQTGYKVSQVKRKRIEEVFGWLKTVGVLRKTRHRGVHKVGWVFTLAAAAYNLVRMRNLVYTPVQSV
jgi:Transposase DDE domain